MVSVSASSRCRPSRFSAWSLVLAHVAMPGSSSAGASAGGTPPSTLPVATGVRRESATERLAGRDGPTCGVVHVLTQEDLVGRVRGVSLALVDPGGVGVL